MKKQILVCLSDSPTSSEALSYVAHLFAGRDEVELTLYHCVTGATAAFPRPEDQRHSLTPDQPVSQRLQKGEILLERARQKLVRFGIVEQRIKLCVQTGDNTARMIHQFGNQQLVDAIVVARRGVGIVGGLLLGSVSSALFDSCRSIPLWVIDGTIESNRFLVPVDGTANSLMAIDHLAHIFSGRADARFFLFHVRNLLSSPPVCRPEHFYDRWGKQWCDSHLSGTGCMFSGPTDLLVEAGIVREAIVTLPEPMAIEESSAIIRSAKKHGCGTIVIGRRPQDEVKSIFGGVSKRTILQTENLALWVIG
ncbi:MAG: universal stress protein [Desulfopila sp.]